MKAFLTFILLFLQSLAVFSQQPKKIATAILAGDSPRIDGVLDEKAWNSAPAAIDFVQREPYNSKPATFKSEARFLYNNSGLYIGVIMYDPYPDSIPVQLGLRDATDLTADNFTFVVSPFNDGINAFGFMVTVSNVQTDFKLSGPDTEDDISWDAIWVSKARINEQGWVVEMKIPYSALRFPKKPVQEWGINCQREIRRYREVDTWNLVDSKVPGYVNQCGLLQGITEIKPPLRLSVTPYLSGYLQNSPDDATYDFSYNYGMDLKYGINQSFTLDMTLIPDFGQVKTDDKVYNFSPFEIRYDERRQFFTEGTEMFNKGGIFYTRRVGSQPKGYYLPYDELRENEQVTENPEQTNVINATKISGRTARGLGIGVFNAMSANTWASVEDTITGVSRQVLTQGFTNYNTLVLDQNLKNNSYIDLLNTNYYMPTEGYTANVTGTSFKFANKSYTYALLGDGFVSQKFYSHHSPDLGYHYSLSFGKISGNFRYNFTQLLETENYDPNDMGFNVINNRFNNNLRLQYNIYQPFWKVLDWYNSIRISYQTLYTDFNYTSFVISFGSNTTTKKHLSLGVNGTFSPMESHDYYESRVPGWMYIAPAYYNLSTWISSDYTKRFAIDGGLGGYVAPETKTSGYDMAFEPRLRVSDRMMLLYHLFYEKVINDIGYVDQTRDSAGNPVIYFGRRDRQIINNILEANFMITSTMSIDVRARHYWVSAPYYSFSVLQPDGRLLPASYPGDADVNYNSFNIDLTYIWNFAPGSQISVMWKNAVETYNNIIETDYFEDFRTTLISPASNSFSIRVLFYLDALYFKKKKSAK